MYQLLQSGKTTMPTPYTVKKVIDVPVPSRDVTNQTLPGGENFNYSRPGRAWFLTSWLAGDGKIAKKFYSVGNVVRFLILVRYTNPNTRELPRQQGELSI